MTHSHVVALPVVPSPIQRVQQISLHPGWGCGGLGRGPPVTLCPPPPPSGLSVLIRVRLELRRHRRAGHTIPLIFQAVARRQPERLALVDAGSGACWTFAQLDAYSNAVASIFHRLGFAPGDVVAIFLEGRPEFVGLWLGLAKAGVVAALLNVNLRREPLAFCLGTSGAKGLIYGGEMAEGEATRTRGPGAARCWVWGLGMWVCMSHCDLHAPITAVAEVSGQLGKSLLKFCSGDLGPQSILPDTQLLDPMLKEAITTTPLAQPPSKGMDGEYRGPSCPPCLLSTAHWLGLNTCISCRPTFLHLHVGDNWATQSCHCRA